MKLTLELTREVLREAFRNESFVAYFIKTIQPSEECPTACINAEGVLQYNPEFVAAHVQSPEDLFCLICHELMHPMFGHFVHGGDVLENLAADTVINAAISLVYKAPSAEGSLFKALYKPHGLEGLLRPCSRMYASRYGRLYEAFYGQHLSRRQLSTGEVIHTLKALAPEHEARKVLLLGSHGVGEADTKSELPIEIRAKLAEDFKRTAHFDPHAGYSENLFDFLMDVLNQNLSLKKTLLRRFETRRKVDRFLREDRRPQTRVSPLPIRPSKRDVVLLCAGVPPFHYHNRRETVTHEESGLAVYLDVSGSVNTHLPHIIALLRSFRKELRTVFLFSNAVVESSFEAVVQGRIRSTVGTDFDCIARSILERRLDKAVILTDGYATLDKALADQLSEQPVETLTILFGGKTDCPEFAPFGPVLQLDEVCN